MLIVGRIGWLLDFHSQISNIDVSPATHVQAGLSNLNFLEGFLLGFFDNLLVKVERFQSLLGILTVSFAGWFADAVIAVPA